MSQLSPFDRLRTSAAAYQESCTLIAAAELDLATKILERSNRATADELAAVLNADLRGTTVLLDAMVGLGYFTKSADAVYSVAEPFVEFLDNRNPKTFIPMLRHMGTCIRTWTQLAWVVQSGTPAQKQSSILGPLEDNVSFILAMNSIGRLLASPVFAEIKKAGILTGAFRFIDIGGASGTYTLAMLEAFPESTGTIFDLPVGIQEARKRFVETPLSPRVSFAEGDFYRDEFPNGFDFAWISAIIHQHGRKESRDLYAKAFRALNSQGKVAVRDFVMNPQRTAPEAGTLFGINMLVNTKTGMVYTFDEIREDLESVGFVNVRLAVPSDTMSAVVVAEKP